jgi:FlaA1/EpsC-like NDP-sugar epimerase
LVVAAPSVGSMIPKLTALVPAGFPIKILPSISSVLLGKVNFSYIRDVDPSDLIGRPLIKSDQVRIAKYVMGKSFLVTGGAGSIGSEIVRQLLSSGAKKIIIFDSWEEGVFNLLAEIKNTGIGESSRVVGRIGNIRDKSRILEVLREYPIDCIFHAAAYKHVPLMEENSGEARKTNVIGTRNVLEIAEKAGVREFVLISTDKAVRPVSILGKTKRRAELLMQHYARIYPKAKFCAVRFGNVLNSSGSLLPTVLQQIHSRSPVTITHKDMTRYFMSIPEAVSLVLTSWIVGKNGEILHLDMGKPVKILDLLHSVIKLHGLEPGKDIELIEIGVRPGEKIHEELMYDYMNIRPSAAPRIYISEDLKSKTLNSKIKLQTKTITK